MVGVGVGIALGEFLGPVLVGGSYLARQLRRSTDVVAPRWQPTALGTSIVVAFLVLQAGRGFHIGLAYAVALLGVVASVVWGWRGISTEVRDRALRLLRQRNA
jgi:membrane associated rhomboid family serine protease